MNRWFVICSLNLFFNACMVFNVQRVKLPLCRLCWVFLLCWAELKWKLCKALTDAKRQNITHEERCTEKHTSTVSDWGDGVRKRGWLVNEFRLQCYFSELLYDEQRDLKKRGWERTGYSALALITRQSLDFGLWGQWLGLFDCPGIKLLCSCYFHFQYDSESSVILTWG